MENTVLMFLLAKNIPGESTAGRRGQRPLPTKTCAASAAPLDHGGKQ
ncbi:hypothetical protein SAMN04488078_101337 [Antarctobacter heliothermus]|uniref:Uncharacterized protein n=1 Tax=Antarctobacter heliothermus TaxID=74033 RepID=A0A239E4B4_9RHOB|nr:hypothetical protein SAMN04488078_101337 [Antarctobacter heliothermus]